MRCLLLDIEILGLEIRQHGGPRNEGQIRVRAFPTNQISIAILLQHRVQDLGNTLGLVLVTFDGAGELLVVEHGEPSSLTKVRALTGHLVVEVLLGKVLFREGGEANRVVLVVLIDQILYDGARLGIRSQYGSLSQVFGAVGNKPPRA